MDLTVKKYQLVQVIFKGVIVTSGVLRNVEILIIIAITSVVQYLTDIYYITIAVISIVQYLTDIYNNSSHFYSAVSH